MAVGILQPTELTVCMQPASTIPSMTSAQATARVVQTHRIKETLLLWQNHNLQLKAHIRTVPKIP